MLVYGWNIVLNFCLSRIYTHLDISHTVWIWLCGRFDFHKKFVEAESQIAPTLFSSAFWYYGKAYAMFLELQ